jgi:DNA sulfur modification protein DndD
VIERLQIERFGLFRDRHFALGPVTVFLGANETGKTTIFDALVQGVCDPGESSIHGRKVKQRYGDRTQRNVAVEPAPAESPDAAEFLSVHAIRSGDADLRMATKNWLEKLRASVFSSGLNLANIAELVSADGRKAGRRLEELEAEREGAREVIEAKQGQRDAVLAQRGALDAASNEIATLKGQEDVLQAEVSTEEAAIALQRRWLERRRLVGLIDDIGLQEKEERALLTLEPVERDWSARIAAARGAEATARTAHATAEGSRDTLTTLAKAAAERAETAASDARVAEGLRGKYARLQTQIEQAPAAGSVIKVQWSAALVVLGAVVLLSGLAGWLLLGGTPGAVAMGAGVVVGAALVVRARRQVLDSDTRARDTFLNARRADFERLCERSLSGGNDALTMAVATALAECDSRIEAATKARGARDTAQGEAQAAATGVQGAGTSLSAAEGQVARLFTETGVADEADLKGKKQECIGLRQRIEERRGRLQGAQDEVGLPSLQALATVLSARFQEEPPTPVERELTPAELQRREGDLALRRTAVDRVRGERGQMERQHAGHEGELRGTLGKLPEEIAAAERRAAQLEADVEAQRLEERAHEFAASVFEEVARDTQDTVRQLAAEAAQRLGALLGAARDVVIAEIEDPSTFRAMDAGGAMRAIDLLSRGTRDALLFAVRLALAERLSGPVPILLLDEPFGALDPDRIGRLLSLLQDFRERLKFQLVFFTKEPALRDAVCGAFPGAVVHELGLAS